MFKFKKIVSLFLAFALTIGSVSISSFAAAADSPNTAEKLSARSANDVADGIIETLVDDGATIKANTVIEVVPIDGGQHKALGVVNLVGNDTIEKSIFIDHTEGENGEWYVDSTRANVVSLGSKTYEADRTLSTITVHVTVKQRLFSANFTCYQPYSVSFSYSNPDNKSVSLVEVELKTVGFLYTTKDNTFVPNPDYPNNPTAANSKPYDFTLLKSVNNPRAGTTYTTQNAFLSNKGWMMEMVSGGLEGYLGQIAYIYAEIDGTIENHTFTIV